MALILRTGFGGIFSVILTRNPQNPILVIQAPTLPVKFAGGFSERECRLEGFSV